MLPWGRTFLPKHAKFFDLGDQGGFAYVPDDNFSGNDHFTYFAKDSISGNLSFPTTAHIQVENVEVDLPASEDDSYWTYADLPLYVSAPGVLANDSPGDVGFDPPWQPELVPISV